jgi:hypothetical protein
MQIKVYYQTGEIDLFDTSIFCSSEPIKEVFRETNITTEVRLRLDLIDTEGLRVDFNYYNASVPDAEKRAVSEQGDALGNIYSVYHAMRKPYRTVLCVSKEEMYKIVKIVVDGEMICWRQGTELINGIKFYGQEILCYSDSATSSINKRVAGIWQYLHNAYPSKSDADIAELMGYTEAAFRAVLENELAQVGGSLDDEENLGGRRGIAEPTDAQIAHMKIEASSFLEDIDDGSDGGSLPVAIQPPPPAGPSDNAAGAGQDEEEDGLADPLDTMLSVLGMTDADEDLD